MSITQQTPGSDTAVNDGAPTRMDQKPLFVRAAFLNAAVPFMRDINEYFNMRGEEKLVLETPSYQYILSRDFSHDLHVELRMKSDNHRCEWKLNSSVNGSYHHVAPNPELNREVLRKHLIGYKSSSGPSGKKKPVFYGQHHWFNRLVLLHTRMAIEGFELGHVIDRMKRA